MTLTFYYGERGGAWEVDLGTDVVRLGGVALTESADHGSPSTSHIEFDDPDGDVGHTGDQIMGLHTFRVVEDAAPSGNQCLYYGITDQREYLTGDSLVTGAAVRIACDLNDLNVLNQFVYIRSSTGNRGRESVDDRIAWIVGLEANLADNGLIASSSVMMDAVDYRNQSVDSVLADCAEATGFNYRTYWDEVAEQYSLAFYDPNTSTLESSDLRISNILSEVDSTLADGVGPTQTWAPQFMRLKRDPRTTADTIGMPYASSTYWGTRTATFDTYGRRCVIAADSNVKTASEAARRVNRLLWENRGEEDIIECAVDLPPENVNDVRAGQRIQIKTRNLPGYTSAYTWMRVVSATKAQEQLTQDFYTVHLTLSPQEEAPSTTCGGFDLTTLHTCYPLGGSGDYFNAVPAADFMYMCRSGLTFPVVPTPGYVGRWWFKTFGSSGGGIGTVDYAGPYDNNTLRAVVVGNGTLQIVTVARGGGSGTFTLNVWRQNVAGIPTDLDDYFTLDSTTGHSSGATVTVTVDDVDDDSCITVVDCTAIHGVDFGWSSATWTPA